MTEKSKTTMPISNYQVGKEVQMAMADFQKKKAKLEEFKAQRSPGEAVGGPTDEQMKGYIIRTRKATKALIELMPTLTKVDEARLERAKNINLEK